LVVGALAASVALGVTACGGAGGGATPEACAEKLESCTRSPIPTACASTCDQECIDAASCDDLSAAASGEENALAACLQACVDTSTISGSVGSSSSGSGTGASSTSGGGVGGGGTSGSGSSGSGTGAGGGTTGGGGHAAICKAVAAKTVACCPAGVANGTADTESEWEQWCESLYDSCPQSFQCQAASSDCNDNCPTIGNGGC